MFIHQALLILSLVLPTLASLEPYDRPEPTASGWRCCEAGALVFGDFVGRMRPTECTLIDKDLAPPDTEAKLGCCEVCRCTFGEEGDCEERDDEQTPEIPPEPEVTASGWRCCEGGEKAFGDFVGRIRPEVCTLIDKELAHPETEEQLGCCEVCKCTFGDKGDCVVSQINEEDLTLSALRNETFVGDSNSNATQAENITIPVPPRQPDNLISPQEQARAKQTGGLRRQGFW